MGHISGTGSAFTVGQENAMTPQERELIEGLFQRLKAADKPQKDQEADELIKRRIAEQPSAPYLLAQTTLVQEHALNAAQQRIAQLEGELANRQGQPAGGGTSFLGGLLARNRWNSQNPPDAPAPVPPAPRSSVPITAPAASSGFAGSGFGGSGFLGSALTTAAGVAGGALLYDGIRSLFFHNPGPFGPSLGAGWSGGAPMGGNIYETNVTNNYNDTPQGGQMADSSAPDGSDRLQDASYDPSDDNFDADPGSDFSDSQDI